MNIWGNVYFWHDILYKIFYILTHILGGTQWNYRVTDVMYFISWNKADICTSHSGMQKLSLLLIDNQCILNDN